MNNAGLETKLFSTSLFIGTFKLTNIDLLGFKYRVEPKQYLEAAWNILKGSAANKYTRKKVDRMVHA